MAITLPPGLAKLFGIVAGMPWPQADEDELRAVWHLFEDFADDIDGLTQYLVEVIDVVAADFEGLSADAFLASMRNLIGGGGGEDYLSDAKQTALQLGKVAQDTANDVEYAKWMIIGQLVMLAAQIAFAIAWSPFTFGATLAELIMAIAGVRAAVAEILAWLLKSILMHTVVGAGGGVLMSLIIQKIQIGDGDRSGIDGALVAQGAEFGVVNGILAAPMELGGFFLGELGGRLLGRGGERILADELADDLGSKAFARDVAKTFGNARSGFDQGFVESGRNLFRGSENLFLKRDAPGLLKQVNHLMGEDGFNARKAGSLAVYVSGRMGEVFAEHLGEAVGDVAVARMLGRRFGAVFVAGWGRTAGHADGFEAALGKVFEDTGLQKDAVTALSQRLPESMDGWAHDGDRLFQLGKAVGELLRHDVENVLAQVFYGLIFQHGQVDLSWTAFTGGLLVGAIGSAGHAALGKVSERWAAFVREVQTRPTDGSGDEYFPLWHPMTWASVASNLAGFPAPLRVPRFGGSMRGGTPVLDGDLEVLAKHFPELAEITAQLPRPGDISLTADHVVELEGTAPGAHGPTERSVLGTIAEETEEQLAAFDEPQQQADPPIVAAHGPWYTRPGADALGDFTVSDWPRGWERRAAEDFGAAVAGRLEAPAHFPERQGERIRQRVGDIVSRMLAPEDDAGIRDWKGLLRLGRYQVVEGHVVWVRPFVRDLTPVDPPPGVPAVRTYEVSYTGVSSMRGSQEEKTGGIESLVEPTLNLASGSISSLIPGAPTISGSSQRTVGSKSALEVVSGRKIMSAGADEFGAGLEFHVYVDGTRWESGHVLENAFTLRLLKELSAVPGRPLDPARGQPGYEVAVGHRPPLAHLAFSAINLDPVVAALQRDLLDAGVGPDAVLVISERIAEEMLNETSMLNLSRWWVTSGYVSDPVVVAGAARRGGLPVGSFHGSMTARVRFHALERVPDAGGEAAGKQTRIRYDLGVAASRERGAGQTSSATLASRFDVGGLKAAHVDGKDGGYLAVEAALSRGRKHSSALSSLAMNKTTLMRDTRLAHYWAHVEVTVETNSSTHTVRPTVVRTTAAVELPEAEAQEFEQTMFGGSPESSDEVPAPVHAPAPVPVPVLTGMPALAHERPGDRLDDVRSDGFEPMALAARRGTGFGMTVTLTGSERVYHSILAVLRAKVALARARGFRAVMGSHDTSRVNWSQAERDLSVRFGTPAFEGDLPKAMAGVTVTVRIDGVDYDVSVTALMGRRVRQDSYEMTVNARGTTGSTVASAQQRSVGVKAGVGGSARFKRGKHVTLEAGDFGVEVSREWTTGSGLTSGSKFYRRTETEGTVDANVYEMVYRVEVLSRDTSDPRTEPWYVHGDDVLAALVIPRQHRPTRPPALPGRTTVERLPIGGPRRPRALDATGTEDEEAPGADGIDFSTGTDGIYPVFMVIPELAREASRLHAVLNGLPEPEHMRDQPEQIREMSHPTALQTGFDDQVSAHGWTERLPDHDGWKQAVRYELSIENISHEKLHEGGGSGGDGWVEIEAFAQNQLHTDEAAGTSWGADANVALGPVFAVSGRSSSGGLTSSEGDGVESARKASNQISLNVSAGAGYRGSNDAGRKLGSIDNTRTTYAGPVHAYRGDPRFTITVMRWKGSREQALRSTVRAPGAVEFLVGRQRREDLKLPLPEPLPAPEPEPTGEGEGGAGNTVIAMIDPELALSMAHPEVMYADDVLEHIVGTLREAGLLRGKSAMMPNGRPNDLMLWVTRRFKGRALQNEWVNLRRTGVSGWFPIPGPFGARQHLYIDVTMDLGKFGSSTLRDDVKLTVRAEGFEENTSSVGGEREWHSSAHLQGHGSAGDRRFGAGVKGEYQSAHSRTGEASEAVRQIFRANGRDRVVGGMSEIRFRVRMGLTSEPPEVLGAFLAGVKRSMVTAGDLIGRAGFEGDAFRTLWRRARPWHWLKDSDRLGPQDRPKGTVRLLVPRHLTAEALEHPEMPRPDFGRDVRWISAASSTGEPDPGPRLSQAALALLIDAAHPNGVPAAHAIARWAGLTTMAGHRRGSDRLSTDGEPWRVPELGLDSRAGLLLASSSREGPLRANVEKLLRHAYVVWVRGRPLRIGLDVRHVERISSFLYKGRRYTQIEASSGAQSTRGSGFAWQAQFVASRAPQDDRLYESSSSVSGGAKGERSNGSGTAEVDEADVEGTREYHYYRMDVDVLIAGPEGTLKMTVPGGLYPMMPAEDAIAFEAAAKSEPGVFSLSPGEAEKERAAAAQAGSADGETDRRALDADDDVDDAASFVTAPESFGAFDEADERTSFVTAQEWFDADDAAPDERIGDFVFGELVRGRA